MPLGKKCMVVILYVILLEEEDKFSVYIKKGKDVLPWKDFNKNMAVSVEYNLQY
jgi:hypothetical protein